MKKFTSTILFLLLFIQTIFSQINIPVNFFGINYWMPHQYINSSAGTPGGFVNYSPIQTQALDAGISFFRIGGKGYDEFGTNVNDYVNAIASVLAVNPYAKFLIQMPFKS